MIVHEMREPLPVETPLGRGVAILVIVGVNDNTWTVALESRAIVDFPQNKILLQKDYTNNRGINAGMLKEMIEQVVRKKAETE